MERQKIRTRELGGEKEREERTDKKERQKRRDSGEQFLSSGHLLSAFSEYGYSKLPSLHYRSHISSFCD